MRVRAKHPVTLGLVAVASLVVARSQIQTERIRSSGAFMRLAVVVSCVLLMAPMSVGLTPCAMTTPTLLAASVSIETISKSDDDVVSLGVSLHAPKDHLIATKQQIDGVWYQDSSFETILGVVPHVLKSDFVGGDVILSPSRPLFQDWTYHCYVTFVFSDHSVIRIGWRDVKLRAGARSVTHNCRAANCLPVQEPVPAEHSDCALQMTFKGGPETRFE